MALNISYALRYIKRMIGATHMQLPIEDDDIIEIIKQESLYTYSKYFPFQFNIVINEKDRVQGEHGVYYIDGQGLEILGVSKVFRNTVYDNNFYSDNYYERGLLMSPIESIAVQTNTDLMSMSQIPNTFNFIPPNRVEVFPKQLECENMTVTIKTVHPEHLNTIPISMREEFLRLCLYDVRISLYQILKHYNELNTAVGTINLRLEDYEKAEDDRRELLEKFEQKFLHEANRKKFYVG